MSTTHTWKENKMKINFNFSIAHKSQYHKESYKEHVLLVFYHACTETEDKNIRKAAILHDIRKPETFGLNKINEPCFYKHEEVPAEDIEKYIEEGEDINLIRALIMCHMTPYKCLTNKNDDYKNVVMKSCAKTLKKFSIDITVDDEFYNKLMILHQADQRGSIRTLEEYTIEDQMQAAYTFLDAAGIEI